MRKNGIHFVVVSVLITVSTFLVHLLLNAIYQLPVQASAEAVPIDNLFSGHFWLISFLFSLVVVFFLYSIVVFRRKPGDESDGEHFHGNTALEIGWTILPLILVGVFGYWGLDTLDEVTSVNEGERTVLVTGRQWSWQFGYPEEENIDTSAILVLEADKPVVMEMEATDVLHSFWVPEFRVKQDLVPGLTTFLRFTPQIPEGQSSPWVSKLRCAEICGFGHAEMLAEVRVLNSSDYAEWAKGESVPLADLSAAERGELWYNQYACAGCHSTDGSVLAGPTWQGLYGRTEELVDGSTVTADDEYIRSSILNPAAQIVAGFENVAMPANFEEQFAAEQARVLEEQGLELDIVADLIAYIQTLEE